MIFSKVSLMFTGLRWTEKSSSVYNKKLCLYFSNVSFRKSIFSNTLQRLVSALFTTFQLNRKLRQESWQLFMKNILVNLSSSYQERWIDK